MNSSAYRFTLDLHSTQSQLSLPVTRGDTARVLYISLSDGGQPYTIVDGCLAMISIKRPTGTHLEAFCVIESNTTIKYEFEQNPQTAIVEGIHDCSIILYDSEGKQLASPKFTMIVSDRVVNHDDLVLDDEDRTVIDAVLARLAEFGVVSRVAEVTLPATAWESSIVDGVEGDPYYQVVEIEGITENTKVDLLPSVEQLAIFHDKDLAFVTENEEGVVTVYAIGDKPKNDYTMQVSLTEVIA